MRSRVVGSILTIAGIVAFVASVLGVSPTPGSARVVLEPADLDRLAETATLRVAGRSCEGAVRGSGFVIAFGDGAEATDRHLLTNRHLVVAGDFAKVDRPGIPATRAVSAVHRDLDVALVAPVGSVELLPADEAPVVGASVVVAGNVDARSVTVVDGEILGRVDGAAYGIGHEVLLVDARTEPGFSGGPVLDRTGSVVGILQGMDRATGVALAIPIDLVIGERRHASDSDDIASVWSEPETVSPCG